VRPLIDGDGFDITGGVEAAASERAAELVADVVLEGREGRRQQLGESGAELAACYPVRTSFVPSPGL
jgi:hypothetical protein